MTKTEFPLSLALHDLLMPDACFHAKHHHLGKGNFSQELPAGVLKINVQFACGVLSFSCCPVYLSDVLSTKS